MSLNGKKIFIVEDNLQNRVIFQMIFMNKGAQVDFERRGKGAMFHLNNTLPVDLIIMDLMLMDGVTGFDIYDEIRMLPGYREVPIVAVSAMDPSIAIPQVQAKGFAGFIAKPIDKVSFPEQILDILQGHKVWFAGER
jgi:CheY-like chemotaxis protein